MKMKTKVYALFYRVEDEWEDLLSVHYTFEGAVEEAKRRGLLRRDIGIEQDLFKGDYSFVKGSIKWYEVKE